MSTEKLRGARVVKDITRREAIKQISGALATALLADGCARDAETEAGMRDLTEGIEADYKGYQPNAILYSNETPVVSIAAIPSKGSRRAGIDFAVREAIDLLGGMGTITRNKERVLIKPNLVNSQVSDTTSPEVVETLAALMKESGTDVSVGEGAAASRRNVRRLIRGSVCRTKDVELLNGIQDDVFGELGFRDLSERMKIRLVNLHVGDMIHYTIPDNYVFKDIYLHAALHESDLVCSVPMMKTHGLAGVTLGMKNFIGAYPGQVYGTVRSRVHQVASQVEPSGTASAIVDMVKATKVGLTVIDGSTAMEGQGPSTSMGGKLVEMGLIVAGTNALATDMVGAHIMGFEPEEISTFEWAWKAGMKPARLDQIEVRGKPVAAVRRTFSRPNVVPYRELSPWYGPVC
jgi:uncharacterized protein (DUF362 family)